MRIGFHSRVRRENQMFLILKWAPKQFAFDGNSPGTWSTSIISTGLINGTNSNRINHNNSQVSSK